MSSHSTGGLRRRSFVWVMLASLTGGIGLAGCGGSGAPAEPAESKAASASPAATKPQVVKGARGKVTLEPDLSVRERRELKKAGKL